MKRKMEFEFNGKYRDISVKKLTYESGKKFYDIVHYIIDSPSQTRVVSKDIGEIVAMNFLTTSMIEIIFDQHTSLVQLTSLLTNLLDKALKVPLNRLEQAFHGVSSNCYPEQLKIIIDKLIEPRN